MSNATRRARPDDNRLDLLSLLGPDAPEPAELQQSAAVVEGVHDYKPTTPQTIGNITDVDESISLSDILHMGNTTSVNLEWPVEKWDESPERASRKQHAIITYLRRVWKSFIDDNNVIVTREILKEKDPSAAAAVKGYLHYNEFPGDIRIFTSDQLKEYLAERPVSVNRLSRHLRISEP